LDRQNDDGGGGDGDLRVCGGIPPSMGRGENDFPTSAGRAEDVSQSGVGTILLCITAAQRFVLVRFPRTNTPPLTPPCRPKRLGDINGRDPPHSRQ